MASVKFAVIDVNEYLSKKQATEPDLASDWAKLEELYNKKLAPIFTFICFFIISV